MEIVYKVSPTFNKVHRDTSRYIFVMGPVNSGKSTGCIMHLFLNALKQRPDENGVRHSRYAVIRSTYPQLRSSVVKTFESWFKDKFSITYNTPFVGRLVYPITDGTTLNMELMFIAVEDDTAADKLRSWEFTGAYVNECHEIPEYLVKTILAQRTDRYPAIKDGGPVDPVIICDYNAVPTDHWLYKLAEEEKPEGMSFYRQPSAVIRTVEGAYKVNPEAENLEFLSENYYLTICMASSEESINTDLMNNYGERKAGKPVYKDYSDTTHLKEENFKPLRGVPVVIGLDQGLTPAAVFTQQIHDGSVHVFDEISTEDCSLREFAEEYLWPTITVKYPWIKDNFTVVCDPASSQRSMNDAKAGIDIFKDAGLPVKLAKTNSSTERREAVMHFLRLKDKFNLSPSCVMLRKGFISDYRYDKMRAFNGSTYKDVPTKNIYSHVHDALQYAMLEYTHKLKRRSFSRNTGNKKYSAASSIGGY